MNKNVHSNVLRRVLVLLVAVTLLFCAVAAPQAEAADFKASYIKENDDLKWNVQDKIDSNVMFKLPDGVSDDEEISVIITLDVINLMDAYEGTDKTMSFADFALTSDKAAQIRQDLEQKKAEILDILDQKAIAYTAGDIYDTLLTGFELVIKAGDVKQAGQLMPKSAELVIGEVYKPADTQLVENTVNVYETGIFNSANSGFDGTGMVVAVLDTGLDYAHSAFSTDNFTSKKLGLDYETVKKLMGQTSASKLTAGLTADDVYISDKVPFGFDYADADSDVYSDHNNHGTHVSGVICGKDSTITGVAPNAQLVSMKVFSSVMDTARTAWILSALEDCVVLGVDVINMSLGTSAGFSTPSTEELENGVYKKIKDTGISLIVAASNSYSSAYGSDKNGNLGLTSNPDTGTVGSPGTFPGAMSVASINGVETPYILYKDTIMYFSETTNGAAEENKFFDTLLGDKDSVEIEFILIPGVGRSADYSGLDVKGKIALVRRGDNTFEEKAIIAQNQGAAGILIYNNVSGDIKMNVGDAKLAACSISQDMGEMLAEVGKGTLKIARDQTSGPFISDFSSWGPTPSLEIKPEITAHGGNILSAVTGGAYDRLSGTSMACPNIAGVALLLRQYVVEKFPNIANDDVAVNIMINRLMMSTADIILNKNGLPYAVRKQGAGLANLQNCIDTDAIIITYDADGKAMDKTKLELLDDAERTGVYTMSFGVQNFGDGALSYNLGALVMTEGVSDTLTNAGETTVTEAGFILEGAKVEFSAENGTLQKDKLTVEAGQEAKVTVTITLTEENKKYLDDSFENGMYVEGFITLKAASGTKVNMNVPYLAFYGDWTEAPLFDLDYFQTDADERDDSIPVEDKVMADGYATRPIGGVSGDYVSYLGGYYFLQDPEDMIISAKKEYISLSNQDGTIHALSYVWAGMLRNAAKVELTITDDATGEVIYTVVDDQIRKSYGDGGPIRPANVEVDFDVMDYNLKNNAKYTVKMVGYLDYGNGGLETNENNTFEFPLTIDFQAPTVEDVEFRWEYDKTEKKNRLYAKIAVFDNHYAMAMQLGYAYQNAEGMIDIKTFEHMMTPVYSQENSTTYVEYELTDYVYEIKNSAYNKNSFVISCYDYALNYAIYEIGMPDNYTDFYFDSLPEEGLTLNPNEVFSMEPAVYPDTEWSELLEYTSSRPGVVRVVNNKLVAVSSGKATVRVRDPKTNKAMTFNVTVRGENDEGYKRLDKPVADTFELLGYNTQKAYFQLASEDRDIGATGDTRFFEGIYDLCMYPSEAVQLQYKLDAFFPADTEVVFESGNENIVKVDQFGVVTGVAEGFSSITVNVLLDGKSTYYSQSITVEVKNPYINTGASLTHYFGNGGVVAIPADLNLTAIGSFAFSNFDYVNKTPEELAFDDSTTSKQWPIGDNTITKVIIPEGVKRIDSYAFSMLTALEEVVLPSTLTEIAYGAFYNCTSLKKITFSGENNLKLINKSAFENCDLEGTLELPNGYVIGDYAFAGNKNLEGIHVAETLQSIGDYAFAGCKKLSDVQITAKHVKYGAYAFTACEALKTFTVNASVIPAGMFYQAKNLETVIIGANVNAIYEYAFRETNVTNFEVASGNTSFKVQTADYVLSADGSTLIAVSPKATGEFTANNCGGANITTIGRGAFSHNKALKSVKLENVTVVEDYGFAATERMDKLTLGQLTKIGEYAFSETAITQMPSFTKDTVIGKYAFLMSGLKSVTIPDGMTIAEGVFSRCLDLETVVIGNDVVLGDYAFFQDRDDLLKIVSTEDPVLGKLFYYDFNSNMKSLTIGNNVTIGSNAFANACKLESITLGENAVIGEMAFYNNSSLKNIDLSKALSIGKYAFSGDVFNMRYDQDMTVDAFDSNGMYLYTYHGPAIEKVVLTNASSIGEFAFAYCTKMTDVVLGEAIVDLPQYAFAHTYELKNINLDKINTIGDYAFMESALVKADLSSATNVGKYAFMNMEELTELTLNAAGTDLGEGAFLNCSGVTAVSGLEFSKNIGNFAFAYTGIAKADLTAAETIGDLAFYKDGKNPFQVTLGTALITLGDNPFAGCDVEAFHQVEVVEFNGKQYENKIYTYTISDNVQVIDGSLYCKVPNGGLELITFAGTNLEDAKVAEGTVRITSMAFNGSDVKMVTLPYTVESIGHKAFYGCDSLKIVVMNSYHAPILEEEFDASYYESYTHIPGTGDYGDYVDFNGEIVYIVGNGQIPYYMWNATGGVYSNVFYGANFIDYVGYVEDKIMLVRPTNGQNYDSYMYRQYFDLVVNGGASYDDNSMNFMSAMNKLPERVTLEHEALVIAAREAYNKIGSTEQKGLVESIYGKLLTAEQRIKQLKAEGSNQGGDDVVVEEPTSSVGVIIAIVAVVVAGGGAAGYFFLKKRKVEETSEAEETQETEVEEAAEAPEAEEETTTE